MTACLRRKKIGTKNFLIGKNEEGEERMVYCPILERLLHFEIPLVPPGNTKKLPYFAIKLALLCNTSKLSHFVITLAPFCDKM